MCVGTTRHLEIWWYLLNRMGVVGREARHDEAWCICADRHYVFVICGSDLEARPKDFTI